MLIMEDQSAPDQRLFYLGHAQVRRAVGSPRRCLFGPPDPVETTRFVQEEMRQIYERQKKKWNFDFEKEQPVAGGRYLWERVEHPPPEQSRTEAGFGAEVEPVQPLERVQEPAEPAAPAPAPAPAPPAPAAAAPADRSTERPVRQRPITGEHSARASAADLYFKRACKNGAGTGPKPLTPGRPVARSAGASKNRSGAGRNGRRPVHGARPVHAGARRTGPLRWPDRRRP